MIKTKEDFIFIIIRSIFKLLSFVPRRLLLSFSYPIGKTWFALDKNHRNIAMDNMLNAFGDEINTAGVRKLTKANFIQISRVVLEIPYLFKLNRQNLDSYVTFSGEQHLKEALSHGKGVLLLSAHIGNWELIGHALALKFNMQLQVVVRPVDYKPVDRLLTEIRSRTGNIMLDKIKSAKIVTRLLGENKTVAILLDQNASWYDGVYVPFFGRIACTNRGFALFALRSDAAVIPVFSIRQKDGRYNIMFESPVSLVRTGNSRRDMVENTALFNTIIEKYVRMAPDNWFWVHRRWRIKEPPESARKKIEALTMHTSE